MSWSRRRFVGASVAAVAAGVAVPRVARAATKGPRITYHRVPWHVARPVRVAQVTDVHVGWGTPSRMLVETIDAIRRAQVDVTVLTGDYVNRSLEHVRRLETFVARLPGVKVATLGNHDHWSGEGGIVDALRRGGATVLSNESAWVGPVGNKLLIAGVDDGATRHDDPEHTFRGVDAERALVLSHFPNTADRIAYAGGRLVLSGHTHGGQIAPELGRFIQRLAGIKYHAGWYPVGQSRLYVCAGIGQSRGGLRGGDEASAEVSIFDLVPAKA